MFFLKTKRGLSDVFSEMLAESALVGKAALLGDLGELAVSGLDHFAGGLDSNAHKERLGAHAEGFDESTVKLAWRDANVLSEVFDCEFVAELLADAFDGAVDGEVGASSVEGCAVTLRGAHHADDCVVSVEDGQLVCDEPIWEALTVKEEFDDVEFGFA
jgi:hypothetical protein